MTDESKNEWLTEEELCEHWILSPDDEGVVNDAKVQYLNNLLTREAGGARSLEEYKAETMRHEHRWWEGHILSILTSHANTVGVSLDTYDGSPLSKINWIQAVRVLIDKAAQLTAANQRIAELEQELADFKSNAFRDIKSLTLQAENANQQLGALKRDVAKAVWWRNQEYIIPYFDKKPYENLAELGITPELITEDNDER